MAHVTKMFQLLGDDPVKSATEAKTVLDIETRLAGVSLPIVDLRDPDKVYHRQTVKELAAGTPHFRWTEYFQAAGAKPVTSLNVAEPDFFKGVDAALASISMDDWKIYLRWHLIHHAAAALSQDFQDEDFDFYGRVLTGAKQLQPRWQRCVASSDAELGEALGQFFVEQEFPPAAKAAATDMVKNVIAALRDDLHTLDWMSPETRQKALAKLNAIVMKVGYPDAWRDYSRFQVDRGPYVQNLTRGSQFEFARQLAKIGKPVDRAEWSMTPPTVNAYYNPLLNEIVFPAGILQPPLYDPQGDDAFNYGATAAAIGHEMTHGFDDEGRKFDAQGNLRDWWTPEDEKNFNERAECVEKQFDSYAVQDDMHENGKLVLGESIADLGGLNLAYRALQKAEKGKKPASIGGLTADQRFYLSYAQIWASNDRPEFERLMVNTNPHPLGRFRAVASPSNMPEFARAFDCKEGDAMARASAIRCQIW
jgi:putative endopeptidase